MAGKRIAVIGAGPSGIAASKKLLDENHDITVFEREAFIGGQWVYIESEETHSSCYKNMISATPRKKMEYSDLEMNSSNLPTWKEVLDYLHHYANHFQLVSKIRFEHEVTNVEHVKNLDGTDGWKVTYRNVQQPTVDECAIFDGVAVCSGQHWKPFYPPEIAGRETFKGKLIHSHHYRESSIVDHKKVLVVGMGISGCDISQDITNCSSTLIQIVRATRRYEKFKMAVKTSTAQRFMNNLLLITSKWLPIFVCRMLTSFKRYLELKNWLHLEKDIVKPFVKQIREYGVEFTDGTYSDVDVIIFSTGYQISFPFLSSDITDKLNIRANPVIYDAYQHVVRPEYPTLAFIGMLQVYGSLHPVAEKQAEWWSKCMSGRCGFPSQNQMNKWIDDWKQKSIAKKAFRPIMVPQETYIESLATVIAESSLSASV